MKDADGSKRENVTYKSFLRSYIEAKESKSFQELCDDVFNVLRERDPSFVVRYEDSLLRCQFDVFFNNFFKRIHQEFKKHFGNILVPLKQEEFARFKKFLRQCAQDLGELQQEEIIKGLSQVEDAFNISTKDIKNIIGLMKDVQTTDRPKEQQPKSKVLNRNELLEKTNQSHLFKYLIETVDSYDALHGKLNPPARTQELAKIMEQLEDQVARADFNKEEIEARLSLLKSKTNETIEVIQSRGEDSKKRATDSLQDIIARADKTQRKILKMATNRPTQHSSLIGGGVLSDSGLEYPQSSRLLRYQGV